MCARSPITYVLLLKVKHIATRTMNKLKSQVNSLFHNCNVTAGEDMVRISVDQHKAEEPFLVKYLGRPAVMIKSCRSQHRELLTWWQ